MTPTPDESLVTFSSKELFLDINRKLDLIMAEQARKADKTDLDKLDARVDQLQLSHSTHVQESNIHISDLRTIRSDMKMQDSRVDRLDGMIIGREMFGQLEQRVRVLETDSATKKAVESNEQKLDAHTSRMRLLVWGMALNAVGIMVELGVILFHAR